MKQAVNPLDYASDISTQLKRGVLLTTAADGKVNTMTIGWGHIGCEWGKNIFVAYVRKSRHSRKLLDQNGEFTVNIPLDDSQKEILRFCGSKSGRNVDKIQTLGLTVEEPDCISVPGIKELPLTLECKVIYRREQELKDLPVDILNQHYQAGSSNEGDSHIAFYGEIVSSYIIK